MDLYTKTSLTNSRHSDLLAEAHAARLAADGAPAKTGMGLRVGGAGVAGLLAKARTVRIHTPAFRKAPAAS